MNDLPQSSKSPWLAGLFSGILPGLGQMYCGQLAKGAGFIAAFVIAKGATFVMARGVTLGNLAKPADLAKHPGALAGVGVAACMPWIVRTIAGLDSWLIAAKLRAGASVSTWEFF